MDDLSAPYTARPTPRMIVDLHTRLWTSTEQLGRPVASQMRRRRVEAWDDHTADPEGHREAMEPVDRAIVLGFESKALGGQISHEQVASYVARDPDKLLGFAGIDPKARDPVMSLDNALGLGLVGVVVSPAAAGFHPTDTRAMALFEACQERRVPVLFESGALLARDTRMEFARPVLLDEVAREFPNLKIILGSCGDPWVDECVALMAKHPTVYASIAGLVARPWQLFNALLAAHQLDTIGQVLFGSNYPHTTPEQAIKTIYSVNTLTQGTQLPSVPREQLRTIVERDTIKTLGLDQIRTQPKAEAAQPDHEAESEPAGDDRSAADAEDSAPEADPKPQPQEESA
ncbi:MAG: amidohydrolase family protein [Phycisphaerales bacterium JB063]